MKILLAEDDIDIADAIMKHLRKKGGHVDWSQDGLTTCKMIAENDYELAILDVEMPGKSGIDILKEIRNRGDCTPVMLATATSLIDDEIGALDTGADEYLLKPFDLSDFDLKVNSMIARSKSLDKTRSLLRYARLQRDAKGATQTDANIQLSKTEYKLLDIFIGNIDRVITAAQIFAQMSDWDQAPDECDLKSFIQQLQRKLGGALYIRQLPGRGFIAELGGGH